MNFYMDTTIHESLGYKIDQLLELIIPQQEI